MLPESTHDALRTLLKADFNVLTHGIKDAAEVTCVLHAVVHEVIHTTNGILFDLASTWGELHSSTRRLPPEMLSACFVMLENFPDRMSVSHVSRAWRAAALAHPAIWSDIDFTVYDFRDVPALLRMALSRTGRYPLHICMPDFDPDDLAAMCVAEHMDHIKVLEWRDPRHCLRLPAPILESFTGMEDGSVIYEDFLAGKVGKLTQLYLPSVCFPSTCPALSTVTNLTLSFPSDPEHAATYSMLFQLFPLLRSLNLEAINLHMAHFLPSGPAPPTLDELHLEALDSHHDLVRLYVDWKSDDNLRDVTLVVDGSTVLECNLQDFFTDAVALSIFVTSGPVIADVAITARCLGQRIRALTCASIRRYDGSQMAELLLSARSALNSVRSLEIPANTLGAFVRLRAFSVLPQLAEIGIFIEGDWEHEFHWELLSDLPRVLEARPRLKLVVITVACDDEGNDELLDADEARELLAVLESFASALPEIRIKGFTEDVASDVQIRPDLNIQFDISE